MTPAPVPSSADDEALVSSDAHGMTRRTLLRRGAIGGETLLVVAAGGLGYRAYDEGVLQTGEGGAYDAWRQWDQQRGPIALVSAAILAANPHNTQAWAFHVSPQRIELFADRARNIGAVDPFRREMYVGLGCAIENMLLAADANGYQATVRLLPEPGQPSPSMRRRSSCPPGRSAGQSSTRRYHTATPTAPRTRLELSPPAPLSGCRPWPRICRTRGSTGSRAMPIVGASAI